MSIKLLTAALAVSALAAPAMAVTTFNVGVSQVITYDGLVDATPQDGLSASMVLTLDSITESGGNYFASFSYELENTSGAPITQSRVSIFGFDIASAGFSFADSSGASSPFDNKRSSNMPNVGTLDICFSGGNNCSGGGGGGLQIGDSALGNFTLAFTQELQSVMFDRFAVRYQAIAGSQFGDSGVGFGTAGIVPEPATWAMLIAGFGMVGFAARRRRHRLQAA